MAKCKNTSQDGVPEEHTGYKVRDFVQRRDFMQRMVITGCAYFSSKIVNSCWFKYSFSFPTFTDFKNPFSSKAIK